MEIIMRELRAEITINAPAERIWDTLTGLESFQEWNPPDGGSSCRFIQREEFSGVLAPLMLLMIGKSTKRGFDEMNQALKVRIEG